MIKVGVADYGIIAWEGEFFDYLGRVEMVKAAGYDGLERLYAQSAEQALTLAAGVRRLEAGFATCRGPSWEQSIQWAAALGCKYVWTASNAKDFDVSCRQVNAQIAHCKRWGLKTALHNHLGSTVETQAQLLAFLRACPECHLVLDTGHLAVAEGGDPLSVVRDYPERIAAVHLKDWVMTRPDAERWHERGYFCELGGGNVPVENEACVEQLLENGYAGWIFVEHDTHLRDPEEDLRHSRAVLRRWGV